MGLNGPSGSGKSRLLRALADLDPHGGELYLQGQACQAIPAPLWRQRVGLLPAEPQWWYDTAAAHFDHPPVAELERLDLPGALLQQPVRQLSTGERQRLALLRLLQHRPRVLLLDEPTASLDEARAEAVEALVRDYLDRHQAAALWVSHTPQQLARVTSRQLLIQSQRLESVA